MNPSSIIELPRYTREQAIKDDPELVWRHETPAHRSNADVCAISDYRYEGRS